MYIDWVHCFYTLILGLYQACIQTLRLQPRLPTETPRDNKPADRETADRETAGRETGEDETADVRVLHGAEETQIGYVSKKLDETVQGLSLELSILIDIVTCHEMNTLKPHIHRVFVCRQDYIQWICSSRHRKHTYKQHTHKHDTYKHDTCRHHTCRHHTHKAVSTCPRMPIERRKSEPAYSKADSPLQTLPFKQLPSSAELVSAERRRVYILMLRVLTAMIHTCTEMESFILSKRLNIENATKSGRDMGETAGDMAERYFDTDRMLEWTCSLTAYGTCQEVVHHWRVKLFDQFGVDIFEDMSAVAARPLYAPTVSAPTFSTRSSEIPLELMKLLVRLIGSVSKRITTGNQVISSLCDRIVPLLRQTSAGHPQDIKVADCRGVARSLASIRRLMTQLSHLVPAFRFTLTPAKTGHLTPTQAKSCSKETQIEGPQQEGPQQEGPQQEGPQQEGPQQEGPQQEGTQEEGTQEEGTQLRDRLIAIAKEWNGTRKEMPSLKAMPSLQPTTVNASSISASYVSAATAKGGDELCVFQLIRALRTGDRTRALECAESILSVLTQAPDTDSPTDPHQDADSKEQGDGMEDGDGDGKETDGDGDGKETDGDRKEKDMGLVVHPEMAPRTLNDTHFVFARKLNRLFARRQGDTEDDDEAAADGDVRGDADGDGETRATSAIGSPVRKDILATGMDRLDFAAQLGDLLKSKV